jgi:DNA-binding transcriptional ArsR family regulator
MPADRCEVLCLDLEVAESLRNALRKSRDVEAAASRARALGDPTRLLIAVALMDAHELCGCDLAWIVERAENLVSHHLRVLRAEGVIESRRDGRMVMHSLSGAGVELLTTLLPEAVSA